MRVTVYSAKQHEIEFLSQHNEIKAALPEVTFDFVSARLSVATAAQARGADAVCIFVNDNADSRVLQVLSDCGVKCLLLRCAGFNQVDIEHAANVGIYVLRVPAYSPHAVAEFAVALALTAIRKTHKAYNRSRESNFALRGLMGFDVHGKTVGVIGTGKIGRIFAIILKSFGTRVIGYDVYHSEEAKKIGVEYVTLNELFKESDLISIHCPLLPSTRHMIDESAVSKMKKGVVLINTSRGELVNIDALINGLRKKIIGACGMDVVEGEQMLFFDDHSGEILENERISTLLSFPNVIITPHMAFCTDTAMSNIWTTTVQNLADFRDRVTQGTILGSAEKSEPLKNQVLPQHAK